MYSHYRVAKPVIKWLLCILCVLIQVMEFGIYWYCNCVKFAFQQVLLVDKATYVLCRPLQRACLHFCHSHCRFCTNRQVA